MLKICRLCLREGFDSDYLDVFDNNEVLKLSIAVIISKYLWFEVNLKNTHRKHKQKIKTTNYFQPSKSDKYSQFICTKCWKQLKNFHDFYQYIQTAQDALQKKFEDRGCPSTNLFDIPVKIEPEDNDKILDAKEGNLITKKIKTIEKMGFALDPLEVLFKTEPGTEILDHSTQWPSASYGNQDERQNDKIVSGKQNVIQEIQLNKCQLENNKTKKKQINLEPDPKRLQHEQENGRIRDFFNVECELCKEQFKTFCKLCVHYKQKHSIKNGFVSCCNRKFQKRSELLQHIDWHVNPDAFRCKICNKQLRDNYSVKLHMQRHVTRKEQTAFSCDVCGKKYREKRTLKKHLIWHQSGQSSNETYKCERCDKS